MKKKGISDLVGKVVIVGVKASKEIPRTALVWALTHVVQPGDCIKLLVAIPRLPSSKNLWGISRFASDCTSSHRRSLSGTVSDQKDLIVDSCSQMMLQLGDVYDPEKVKIRVKIVYGCGVVAAEAKKVQSNWVILDKQLRHEKKLCMEELQCNVVVMKQSHPKVLRLNLIGSPNTEPHVACQLPFNSELSLKHSRNRYNDSHMIRVPFVTPSSSPEQESPLTTTDVGTSSVSSSEPGTSPFFVSGNYRSRNKESSFITDERRNLSELDYDTDVGSCSSEFSQHIEGRSKKTHNSALSSSYEFLLGKLSPSLNKKHEAGIRNRRINSNMSKSVREAISLSKKKPPGPPPLCSICQHKAPIFGNPPRWFTYSELEVATNKFSQANFLAEGGFGSVHRGVLATGQVVAVKQHKLASSQGDQEFCSEVEVLSCAQHRNVVMLIGFCVDDGKRLLVYEYICNGSLDSHLYGCDQDPLPWAARQKIAVGAARGLRYLHEECRVGCIVHRDMRPNNILLTHDFEPLVGDFGLARWQPDGDLGVETRIIGRFGYLAPEYAQTGQITEKADVYSFGVVLVELITGRKAMDINRPKGQQCLTEWARPRLKRHAIDELLDPRLRTCYSEQEVLNMMRCAYLCIRRDPLSRPRMSQVLRMLEGDVIMNW